VCALERLEKLHGDLSKELELWVERGVGDLKRGNMGRNSHIPVDLLVRTYLRMKAVVRFAINYHSRDIHVLIPSMQARPIAGPTVDDEDDLTGTLLLGKGKKLSSIRVGGTQSQLEMVRSCLRRRKRPYTMIIAVIGCI
jgi:hypothetical protein